MDGLAENCLIIGVKGNQNQQDATNLIMWEQEHWNPSDFTQCHFSPTDKTLSLNGFILLFDYVLL